MMEQVTASSTLIQTTVDPAMRGRVISFYAMAIFGMIPIGSLLVGFVATWVGTPDTVLTEGIITLVIGAFLLFRVNANALAAVKNS